VIAKRSERQAASARGQTAAAASLTPPAPRYANFSEAEQAKILKAGRCNNFLATDKLQAAVPDLPLPHVKDSLRNVFLRMK
jgi:hypothetical protein